MRPLRLNLRFHLSEDEDLDITFQSLRSENILCFAARTAGKGTIMRNPPKGWIIRRDAQDDAFEGQQKHYHCKKDGNEIVITQDGYGSHNSQSGDPIPKKLGEYLEEQLGILVKTDQKGKYVIRFEVQWPWYPYRDIEPVEIMSELLNTWVVIDSGNEKNESDL